MNDALRDLARHADAVTPPALDVAGIIERGDARRRRRRAGASAGVALSVILTVGLVGTLLDRTDSSGPPVDEPTIPVPTHSQTLAPVRPLVYTDDYRSEFTSGPSWPFRSLQYGDRTLRLGLDVLHVDVTDDGLVLEDTEGGVHLADGDSVTRIGSVAIQDGMAWTDGDVVSGASGSLAAWVAAGTADLVVYDTHERRVTNRIPVPLCADSGCYLVAIVVDHVYLFGPDTTTDGPEVRVDVSTGVVTRTDLAAYQADLRRHPRAIVTGTGEVVSDELILVPRDGLLEPSRFVRDGPDDQGVFAYGGTDTLGRTLELRLPEGYRPDTEFALFMWLDDDRFAAMAGAVRTAADKSIGWNDAPQYGDILVCDIAEGRCRLAARGPSDPERFRLVPHVDTPN